MDARWHMERAHRIIERAGGPRRQRVFADQVAGEPAIFTTSFDGENLIIDDFEPLPDRLAGPLCRLAGMREQWLDLLPHSLPLRQHNILLALEQMERFVGVLRRRALSCKGTRYLLISIVDVIAHAAQQIANHPFSADGVVEDEVFATAGLRITNLLRAAGCRHQLAA